MIAHRTVPIFDVDIHLFNDRAEARGFMRDHSPDWESQAVDTARGCCITQPGNPRMLCVFDGGLAVATHESVHMAWAILQECGVRVTAANDEPLAYLAAWINQQVAQFLSGEVTA